MESLLANDQVRRRDRPEVRAYTQASHGAVTLDGQSTLTYTPARGFRGKDSFQYTVSDQRGRRSSATVNVRVSSAGSSANALTSPDVERLYYEYKKDALTENSRDRLSAIAAQLSSNPAARIIVRTFTDNVGSASYNQRLSARRATGVRQMLTRLGVDPGRIDARGEGENSPIASNKTDEGRAQNRRVELRVIRPSNN